MQADIAAEDDRRPLEVLAALSQAADIPLLLREEPPLEPCPDDAPWKDRFDEALQPASQGDWQTAAERLTALAADVPDAPAVWRTSGHVPRLAGRQCRLRSTPCENTRRCGPPNRTDWRTPSRPRPRPCFWPTIRWATGSKMFTVVWTVKDVERAQEALLSSPRMRPLPFDPAQFSDGQTPPPKAAYMLLDRPMPESAEGLSLETMPRMLGQALLFGRQTDREARFEVMGVAADELPAVMSLVREVAGDALGPAGQAGSRRRLVGQPEAAPRGLAAAAGRLARTGRAR